MSVQCLGDSNYKNESYESFSKRLLQDIILPSKLQESLSKSKNLTNIAQGLLLSLVEKHGTCVSDKVLAIVDVITPTIGYILISGTDIINIR